MGSSSSALMASAAPEPSLRNRCSDQLHLEETLSIVGSDHGINNSLKSDELPSFNRDEDKDPIESMDPENVKRFKDEASLHLKSICESVRLTNVYLEENASHRGDVLDKIRYIFNLYGALVGKTSRREVEQYKNEIAQIILETNLIEFITKLIVDYPIDIDSGGASMEDTFIIYVALMLVFNYTDASDALAVAIMNTGVIEVCQKLLQINCKRHLDGKLEEITEQIIHSCLGLVHNVSMRETNVERLRQLDFTKTLQPYLKSPDEEISMVTMTTLADIVIEAECDIIAANILLVARLIYILQKGMASETRRCSGWSCKECGLAIRHLAKNDANKKLLWNLGVSGVLVKLAKTGDEDEQRESIYAIWALCFDNDIAKNITGDQEIGIVELLLDLRQSSTNNNIKNACTKCLWTLKDELKISTIQSYREAADAMPSISRTNVTGGHVMISYQRSDRKLLCQIKENLSEQSYKDINGCALTNANKSIHRGPRNDYKPYWSKELESRTDKLSAARREAEHSRSIENHNNLQQAKVWMDIEQMGGSTLQAMAEAVENAAVVLLCYSRRYKESDNCRLEAEYAHEQKKRIIPLKMEQDYKPDGWLGIMIGSKYFVEFSGKYTFDHKLKDLFKELKRTLEIKPAEPFAMLPVAPEVTYPMLARPHDDVDAAEQKHEHNKDSERVNIAHIDHVRQWSEDDVHNWLTKYNLRNHGLDGLTGEEIWFLARMLLDAPEQIYHCLRKDLKVKTLLVKSRLVWALHELTRSDLYVTNG